MIRVVKLDRRRFLQAGAAAGVALCLGACREEEAAAPPPPPAAPPTPFDALVAIDAEGRVTVTIAKTEMGQGVSTALPMIVAEELDVPFERVQTEMRVADAWPPDMGTAASASIRFSYEPLRRAGAAAREMLITAAAARWGVPVEACRSDAGAVLHDASGRRLAYGVLVEAASQLPVPAEPRLRDPDAFRVIGTMPPRLDLQDKLRGRATYGFDLVFDGQACALLLPPGTGTAGMEAEAAALATPGVHRIVDLPEGRALVADDVDGLRRARERLETRSAHAAIDLEPWWAELAERLDRPGMEVFTAGSSAPLPDDARRIEAEYTVPFLAHAALEPASCTARWSDDGSCELHFATQMQAGARIAVERALGVHASAVRIHTPLLGGGFGGKVDPTIGVAAARLARQLERPVQMLRFREEEFDATPLRPGFRARLTASVAADGTLLHWRQRSAGPSFDAQDAPPWVQRAVERMQRIAGGLPVPEWLPWSVRRRALWMADPRDIVALDGAEAPHLPIAARSVEFHRVPAPLRVGWWRSVGHQHNAFFVESFVDEIAATLGRSPLALRRRWWADRPRSLRVLDTVVAASGFESDAPEGRARGLACWECFGGVFAAVVECSDAGGVPRVHRAWLAADAGQLVHPGIAQQQLEGGFLFGLSPTLREAYRPGDANLDDYPILTLAETPEIETHWVPSTEPPAGLGEAGTPLAAPAVANAWAALTGQRQRALPFVARSSRRG